VVVDGYSAAAPLGRMITERGFNAIHVQSSERILFGAKAFRPTDYAATLTFDGDLGRLVSELARWNVVAVTPGIQTGVLLADRLGEALRVPNNGVAQSLDRVDKFAMSRVLEANGLLGAKSFATASVDELVDWFRRSGTSKVIVKPCTSAGTDNVTVCRTEADIRAAFANIFHKTNRMGLFNEAVVIQEFLEGTEYIVNTVSFKGMHRVTDCWQYRKVAANGGSFVYEKCSLLQSSADAVAELIDYTFRMLDAFGVKEGASHNEVMMTKAGPALIEINPRLSGAQIPRLAALAIGEGQLEWTLRVLLERDKTPNGFYEPYQLRQHAMLCPLISHVQGRFAGLRFKEELESLPSFQFADYFVEVGGAMPLTVDCYTQPGIVFLAHPDDAAMQKDYERIRELERNGLYDVAA
jgi:L-amino acid ligase